MSCRFSNALALEFAKYLETLAHPLQQMCHHSHFLQSWTKLNYANVLQRYVTREKNKFEGDCAIVSGLNGQQQAGATFAAVAVIITH